MDKLPLGISFYTFQIAAYIIDVYRGRVPVEKSFIRLGTYVTMFPQLIAGPIINYSEVRMALCSRTVTFEQFESGLKYWYWDLVQRWSLQTVLDFCGITSRQSALKVFQHRWHGWERLHIRSNFILIFPVILWWHWDWDGCLDLNFRKTLNIPIFQDRYPNSGEDGILRLDAGSGNMSIFRLAATGREKHVRYLIYLWYGVWLPSGMGQRDIFWSGEHHCSYCLLWKSIFTAVSEKSKILSHVYLVLVVPLTWMAFAIADVGQLGVYYARMFPFFGVGETVRQMDFCSIWKITVHCFWWGLFFHSIPDSFI